MTEAERTEIQSKIVAALRKLIGEEEQPGLGEMWIESGISIIMAYVDAINSDLDLNWRKPLGRSKVQKELDDIAELYKKLAAKMNQVHQPTHEALSFIGIGPFFERTRCENLIDRIKCVDTSPVPASPGRGQSKMRERNIADRLAIIYANITGENPSRSYDPIKGTASGKFFILVEEVFEAAGISASAEDCARRAVEAYAERVGENGS